MALTLLSLVVAVPGCKKKSETKKEPSAVSAPVSQCQTMLADKVGRAVIEVLLDEKGEVQAANLDVPGLLAQCQTIPARVLSCYSQMDLESPACDSAIGAFLGLTDSTPQGKGPEPEWTADIKTEWFDALATPSGLVVLAYENNVVAYAEGAVVWERPLPDQSSRLAAFDDCILAPAAASLHCLSLEDGRDLWVAKRPGGESEPIVSMATHEGRAFFVGDAGKVWSLDRDACAAKKPCMRDLDLYVDAFGNEVGFAFAQDGYWMIGESNRLRLFAADNKELWSRGGYESDVPVADGTSIAVVSGAALLRIDVAACAAAPKSCAATLATVGDDAVGGPVILADGSVVVIEDAGVLAAYGDTTWKIDVGNDGPLVASGELVFSVGHYLALDSADKPATLRAIDRKTGATRWLSELPGRAGLVDSPELLAAGPTTVAVVDPTNDKLHWFRVPR